MSMLETAVALRPLPHGAVGFWDEVLNLIPLALGSALLLYLYFTSRRHRAKEEDLRDRERDE